jgi:hypothetical protein
MSSRLIRNGCQIYPITFLAVWRSGLWVWRQPPVEAFAVPPHHHPLLEGAREADLTQLQRVFAVKTDIVFKELTPGEWYTFE